MKKAIKMMLFVAAATMFFAACDKDNDDEPKAGDNQMIYDGKTYQGENVSSSVDGNNISLSLERFAEAFIFEINGNIQNVTSSRTYDLTKEDPDHGLFFHIFLESDDLDSEDHIFDFQYQNAPHLWYFLDGDNVSNTSAFTKGTAVATVEANRVILEASGTLVNGKYISFRVVAPKD
jgi:hypothetical protein